MIRHGVRTQDAQVNASEKQLYPNVCREWKSETSSLQRLKKIIIAYNEYESNSFQANSNRSSIDTQTPVFSFSLTFWVRGLPFLPIFLSLFIPNPNNPIPRLGHVRPFKLARRGRAQHAGGTQTTIIETSKLITHLLGGCNADEKENVCALKALTSPSSPAPLPPFLFWAWLCRWLNAFPLKRNLSLPFQFRRLL